MEEKRIERNKFQKRFSKELNHLHLMEVEIRYSLKCTVIIRMLEEEKKELNDIINIIKIINQILLIRFFFKQCFNIEK